ncbi:BlaI/MecI/CopY family transcriptional regulator [Vampirovibrio sp.]|uniref:BlaI/MecI/CopY family transcriptional regulator n=1 Tax=Vampirovibrio sp. TaxID=2717857 RepID=UPI003592F749
MDLKQGDLENIILNALWDLEGDGNDHIFVGDIQEKIKSPSKKWAYTTVKTVLDRLVDKEIAIREKDGKKYLYRSVVNRDEAGILALKKVVRQYFKNDISELVTCLNKLNGTETSPESSIVAERKIAAQQLQETRKGIVAR